MESMTHEGDGAGLPVLLLVEDNPDDVLLARRAVKKAALPVSMQVVEDGDEAVAYLEGSGRFGDRVRHPLPALVLLDLKLPKRPGLEVLRWVRSRPELDTTPVVVLRFEGENPEALARIQDEFRSVILAAKPDAQLPF